MEQKSRAFLEQLLLTPSPSGFEEPVQKVVRKYLSTFADQVETDLHGNVIAAINPKAKRRILLTGHADQIGFMVSSVTKDGFIQLATVGGIDLGVAPGSKVTIYAKKGEVTGIIGRKAIHLQNGDEREKMKLEIEKFVVDIGAKSKEEVLKLIEIGDPITYQLGITELRNGLISSPGLDDKVGLFVAVEALRLASLKKNKLNVAFYIASTVQEEIGLRGAQTAGYSVNPEVGIAIDVDHASDTPFYDATKQPVIITRKGPVIPRGPNINHKVFDLLQKCAKKQKIATQVHAKGKPLGNDANALQISRGGVASATIGIPNRYMHTQVEVCALADLTDSAKLLAEFALSITDKTSFIPG